MPRSRSPRRARGGNQLKDLLTSAKCGNPETIQHKASKMGMELNSVYSCGNTLLTKAIEDNEATSTVEAIIKAGADVDYPNSQGKTALILAVKARRPDLLTVLIEYGADPKLKTPKRISAISLCLEGKLYSYLEILLRQSMNNVESMIEHLEEICFFMRLTNNNSKEMNKSDCVSQISNMDQRLISAIKNVYDVNIKDMNGTTPLMCAVRCHYDDCVRLLLLAGADVNRINKSKETALTLAMTRSHNPILKELIRAGALRRYPRGETSTLNFGMCKMILDYLQQNGLFNTPDIYGKTALMYAVERGDKACIMYAVEMDIEELVKAKFLFDCKNTNFRCVGERYNVVSVSSLCAANENERSCRSSDDQLFEDGRKYQDNNGKPSVMYSFETGKLLEKLFCGKANLRNKWGDSPIFYEIRYCDFLTEEKTKLLVGDTHKEQYQDGKTALMIAVSGYNGGSHTYIEPIVGDSCSIQDKDGKTALMYALSHSLVPDDLLNQLIGDSQNVQDKDGKTALMYALINSNSIPEDLLKQMVGDSQNLQDKYGKTALMYAFIHNKPLSENMIELLAGETPFIQDNDGKTALMYAFQSEHKLKHTSIKNLFDCSFDLQDNSGRTALMYAVRHNCRPPEHLFEQMIRESQFIQDSEGKTALMYASQRSHNSNTMNMELLHRDALIIQDNQGKTALHHAIEHNQVNEYIEQLILHGSHLEVEDKQKRTALGLCLEIDIRYAVYPYEWKDNFVKTNMLLRYNPIPKLNLFGKKGLLKSIQKGMFSLNNMCEDKAIFRLIIINGIEPFPQLNVNISTFFAVLKEHLIDVVKYLIANMYLTNEDLMLLIKAKNYLKSDEYPRKHKMLNFNGTFLDLSSPNIQKLITEATSQPWPLVKLSFVVVSSAVGHGIKRKVRVNRLPLPNPIKDRLMFYSRTALIPVSEWSNIPMVFDPVEYEKTRRPRPLLNYWPFGAELVV